jgi:hypothetical protein
MEIYNRFSIFTYTGSSPLNLISKDPSISSDPIKNTQWENMIQSVDSIYASQSSDNTIPVFWTTRSTTVDNFGRLRYVPNNLSSLTSLTPRSSYYVVMRDTSALPLRIPSNGDVLSGFADNLQLPLVDPNSIQDTILQNDFKHDFKPVITNLRPAETYQYEWKVVSSNWPIAANAISGTIKPASSTGIINSSIAFCPSTGNCSNFMLPYDLPAECSLEILEKPYVTLKLSVKNDSGGPESLSDQFTIICDDCLPRPKITLSSITPSNVVESDADDADTPSLRFKLEFDNLELNKEYFYSINTIYSEWPIVFSTPISGSFSAKSPTNNPIFGTLFFCPTTGLCAPNGDNIPNYDVPNYPKFLTSDFVHNIVLQASLSGNSLCYDNEFDSNLLSISYKRS